MTRKKKLALWVVGVLAAAYLACFGIRWRPYTCICTKCGKLRKTSQFVFLLGGFPLTRSHEEEHTPLSQLLYGQHAVGEHEHNWVRSSIYGGYLSEIAVNGWLMEQHCRSPFVARVTGLVIESGDKAEINRWRHIILDPHVDLHFRSWLLGFHTDELERSDRATFSAWWARNREMLAVEPKLRALPGSQ